MSKRKYTIEEYEITFTNPDSDDPDYVYNLDIFEAFQAVAKGRGETLGLLDEEVAQALFELAPEDFLQHYPDAIPHLIKAVSKEWIKGEDKHFHLTLLTWPDREVRLKTIIALGKPKNPSM